MKKAIIYFIIEKLVINRVLLDRIFRHSYKLVKTFSDFQRENFNL